METQQFQVSFTIAMVCLNAKNEVEKTIQSVIAQEYDNYEIVIVDGMSTDGTYELLEQYSKTNNIRLIHEPDKGIYDAMNKAVINARGDYIFFLGAGDIFPEKKTLVNVAEEICQNVVEGGNYFPALLLANATMIYKTEERLLDFYHRPNISSFRRACGFPTSHQSFMVLSRIMKEKNFDASMKYQADQEILAYLLKEYRRDYIRLNINICNVDGYGVSSRATPEIYQAENDYINRRYNSFWYYILWIPKNLVRKVLSMREACNVISTK